MQYNMASQIIIVLQKIGFVCSGLETHCSGSYFQKLNMSHEYGP